MINYGDTVLCFKILDAKKKKNGCQKKKEIKRKGRKNITIESLSVLSSLKGKLQIFRISFLAKRLLSFFMFQFSKDLAFIRVSE